MFLQLLRSKPLLNPFKSYSYYDLMSEKCKIRELEKKVKDFNKCIKGNYLSSYKIYLPKQTRFLYYNSPELGFGHHYGVEYINDIIEADIKTKIASINTLKKELKNFKEEFEDLKNEWKFHKYTDFATLFTSLCEEHNINTPYKDENYTIFNKYYVGCNDEYYPFYISTRGYDHYFNNFLIDNLKDTINVLYKDCANTHSNFEKIKIDIFNICKSQ